MGRVPLEKYITVFTDASWCPHTKAAGWAVWMKFTKPGDEHPTTLRKAGGILQAENSFEVFPQFTAQLLSQTVTDTYVPMSGV